MRIILSLLCLIPLALQAQFYFKASIDHLQYTNVSGEFFSNAVTGRFINDSLMALGNSSYQRSTFFEYASSIGGTVEMGVEFKLSKKVKILTGLEFRLTSTTRSIDAEDRISGQSFNPLGDTIPIPSGYVEGTPYVDVSSYCNGQQDFEEFTKLRDTYIRYVHLSIPLEVRYRLPLEKFEVGIGLDFSTPIFTQVEQHVFQVLTERNGNDICFYYSPMFDYDESGDGFNNAVLGYRANLNYYLTQQLQLGLGVQGSLTDVEYQGDLFGRLNFKAPFRTQLSIRYTLKPWEI